MKRIIVGVLCLISIISLTACTNEKSLEFKKEYESLNGKKNSSGKIHRTVHIAKNNPYEKIEAKEIIRKIENKDTFYLYVGDPKCPWCRSVVEKSIEVSNKNKVKKIYYLNIWNEDGEEIFRDKYELNNGEIVKVYDGVDEYKKLLQYFDSVLSDYTLIDENNEKIYVGEKRIFAPSYFYIEKGKVQKMVEGISPKQKDSREELTDEILEDEEKEFIKLFNN